MKSEALLQFAAAVSIADAKRIWQRLAALQIRRLETENRLLTLIQLLEEQQDLPQVFMTRSVRVSAWALGTNNETTTPSHTPLLDDVLQRISGPLRGELAATENELVWLIQIQGRELSKTFGRPKVRQQIADQVTDV